MTGHWGGGGSHLQARIVCDSQAPVVFLTVTYGLHSVHQIQTATIGLLTCCCERELSSTLSFNKGSPPEKFCIQLNAAFQLQFLLNPWNLWTSLVQKIILNHSHCGCF